MGQLYYIIFNIILLILIFIKKPFIKFYNDKDVLYTALGDDISKGFIALFFRGFVYRLKAYLKLNNKKFKCNNFAVPSFTSGDLLNQLMNNTGIRNSVKNSKIITISIGGNNLIKGMVDNYNEVDGQILKKGVEDFRRDWPQLLYFIRTSIGSKACIYVMTLYNPFEVNDPNYSIAEYYIFNLNKIISSDFWCHCFDYKVIDSHNCLGNNLGERTLLFNNFFKIPLPNYRGYKKLSGAFIDKIQGCN